MIEVKHNNQINNITTKYSYYLTKEFNGNYYKQQIFEFY